MPTPTDPHARRVAALSAVIALTALTVAALAIDRLDATRDALRTAKASCAGLVRTPLSASAPDIADPKTSEGSGASTGPSDTGGPLGHGGSGSSI